MALMGSTVGANESAGYLTGTSADGIHWTTGEPVPGEYMACGQSALLNRGDSGLWTTTDGLKWSMLLNASSGDFGVIHGATDSFFAIDSTADDRLLIFENGNFSGPRTAAYPPGCAESLFAVSWYNGVYSLWCDTKSFVMSSNLTSWTESSLDLATSAEISVMSVPDGTLYFGSYIRSDESLVIGGISSDGINWKPLSSSSNFEISSNRIAASAVMNDQLLMFPGTADLIVVDTKALTFHLVGSPNQIDFQSIFLVPDASLIAIDDGSVGWQSKDGVHWDPQIWSPLFQSIVTNIGRSRVHSHPLRTSFVVSPSGINLAFFCKVYMSNDGLNWTSSLQLPCDESHNVFVDDSLSPLKDGWALLTISGIVFDYSYSIHTYSFTSGKWTSSTYQIGLLAGTPRGCALSWAPIRFF